MFVIPLSFATEMKGLGLMLKKVEQRTEFLSLLPLLPATAVKTAVYSEHTVWHTKA